MAKYKLTNSAISDLTRIWNYTCDAWSERQADKYYNEFIRACAKISKKPQIGKNYFKIYPELLGFSINHHIIFYQKISTDEIVIIRILHEQMDLKNRILE